MTRLLHYTGRGVPGRWQDAANWSRAAGGRPCGVRPDPSQVVVLDEQSGDYFSFVGVPHKALSVHGFAGTLVMPDGAVWPLRGPRRGWDALRHRAGQFLLRVRSRLPYPVLVALAVLSSATVPRSPDPVAVALAFVARRQHRKVAEARAHAALVAVEREPPEPEPFAPRWLRERPGYDWRKALREGTARIATRPSGPPMLVPVAAGGASTYFWVGGTNTMDGVTLVLATSSGGTATVAAPSAVDSVVFDSNSGGGTATIAIDPACTGWTLATTYLGTVRLTHTMTLSGQMTLTGGTLNTNGQTCSWAAFSSSTAIARTLTMGGSAITVTAGSGGGWDSTNATNMTVTVNTATVTLTGANASFSGNGDQATTSWRGMSLVFSGSGNCTLSVSGTTFANFTRSGTAAKTDNLAISGGLTCTGMFTATGNSLTNRMLIQSSALGTSRTILAGTVSLTNVDFQDVQLNDAPSSISPTFSGNEITNQVRSDNIQGDGEPNPSGTGIWEASTNLCTNGGFETNTTGWGVLGGGSITRDLTKAKFGAASGKVITPGGASNEGAILPPASLPVTSGLQYAVSIWANGDSAVGATVQLRVDYTTSKRSSAFTLVAGWQRLTFVSTSDLTGNATVVIQTNVTQALTFWVDGAQIEQKAFATPYIETNGGTATRAAARVQAPASLLNATQAGVILRIRNGHASGVTPSGVGQYAFDWRSGGAAPFLALRTNNAGTVWFLRQDTGAGTTDAAASAISYASGDYTTLIVQWTATTLSISVNGGAFVTVARSSVITPTNLMFDIGSLAGGNHCDFDVLWAATINGTLTDADATTINAYGNSLPAQSLIPGTPTGTWHGTNAAGTSTGDCQGNSGILFTPAVTRYAVVAGNWSSTATWSTASGGAGGASVPLPQDTVNLDASSAVGTYTADMPRIGKDISCTGFTRTLALGTDVTGFGNLVLAAGMTFSGAHSFTLSGRGVQTITSGGKTFPGNLTLSAPSGSYTLQDDLSLGAASNSSLVHTDGSLVANGHNVTAGTFTSASGNTRTLNLGSGTWTLTRTGSVTVWNITTLGLTFTGASATLVIGATDSSVTKTFIGGGLAYGTLRHSATGSAGLTITGSNTFANLDLECTTARTVTLPASGTTTVTGTLTLAGASGQLLSLVSSAPGTSSLIVESGHLYAINAFVSASADVLMAAWNTAAPALSGTPVVGNVLSTSTGTWVGFPAPTLAYQWKRNAGAIGGATSTTYTLTDADDQQAILCTVTGTNTSGSESVNTGTDTPTEPVAVNTVAPVVSGSALPGSTLSSTTGTWSHMAGAGGSSFLYQWLRDGIVIGGATASTYTTVMADFTHNLSCEVAAVNSGGTSSYVVSSNSIHIEELPINDTPPHVYGEAVVGGVLSTTDGQWEGDPDTFTFAYQWQTSINDVTWANVSGATSTNYTCRSTDVGNYLRCVVTATNAAGSTAADSNSVGTIRATISGNQQGPLPYLDFCGVEVANAARTLSYLKRGLGDTLQGHWELSPGDVCSVLYRVDGSGCIPATFISPARDPAPWFDPDEPGSEDFLGVVMLDLSGYDSVIQRSVTQRITGPLQGGVLSAPWRQPRVWKFDAALISASDAGAEYGLRWLQSVLEQSACDVCGDCNLTVRLVCPPDDCSDDELGQWVSYQVGLIDGPHETGAAATATSTDKAMGGCRDFVFVNWTMVAGNPFLYRPSAATIMATTISQHNNCADFTICEWLFGDTDADCVPVAAPRRGVDGIVATFQCDIDEGMGGMVLEAYEDCDSSGLPVGDVVQSIALTGIPAGCSIVVDSALCTITLIDADGAESDAKIFLDISAGHGIEWIRIQDCDTTRCICVRPEAPCSTGHVNVLLESRHAEG